LISLDNSETIVSRPGGRPFSGEESPSFQGRGCLVIRGDFYRKVEVTDSATENIPPVRVRVKRRCKRPPDRPQGRSRGKPHPNERPNKGKEAARLI